MNRGDDLLFASISCLSNNLNRDQVSNEILNIDPIASFHNQYRNTIMIPFMTKNSRMGEDGIQNNLDGEYAWTSVTPKNIVQWFESVVFPWMGSRSRVMALITPANSYNNEHIDCNRPELNTRQHKIRLVLQGKTSTLYWLTDKGKVYAPDVDTPFLMDGGWPHGMHNDSNLPKVTIAVGAPWHGKDDYKDDIEILQKRSDYNMPNNINHLWNTSKL